MDTDRATLNRKVIRNITIFILVKVGIALAIHYAARSIRATTQP